MFPLQGVSLVFTGKMSKTRDRIEQEARDLGADVEKQVKGRTDYLVCGQRPGQKKISDARTQGREIIDERRYRQIIAEREKALASEKRQATTPPPAQPAAVSRAVDREWIDNIRKKPARISF